MPVAVLASRAVIPLVLAAAGVAALTLAGLVIRQYGPAYRIARTLRAAPEVSLADVEAAARTRRTMYVRAHGRIASDEEFPDDQDRPLVYRRQRLQVSTPAGWRSLDDRRLAVPFGIASRGVYAGVDLDALAEGVVVLPRESRGTAGEVADRVPAGTPPEREVRLRIEQVSAVEHAYVAGVPALDGDGRPMLTAGAGRPLIVCTVGIDEAMRLLGGADRRRAAVAIGLLAAGAVLLLAAVGGAAAGVAG